MTTRPIKTPEAKPQTPHNPEAPVCDWIGALSFLLALIGTASFGETCHPLALLLALIGFYGAYVRSEQDAAGGR